MRLVSFGHLSFHQDVKPQRFDFDRRGRGEELRGLERRVEAGLRHVLVGELPVVLELAIGGIDHDDGPLVGLAMPVNGKEQRARGRGRLGDRGLGVVEIVAQKDQLGQLVAQAFDLANVMAQLLVLRIAQRVPVAIRFDADHCAGQDGPIDATKVTRRGDVLHGGPFREDITQS